MVVVMMGGGIWSSSSCDIINSTEILLPGTNCLYKENR